MCVWPGDRDGLGWMGKKSAAQVWELCLGVWQLAGQPSSVPGL
jgi:hypothetical protein